MDKKTREIVMRDFEAVNGYLERLSGIQRDFGTKANIPEVKKLKDFLESAQNNARAYLIEDECTQGDLQRLEKQVSQVMPLILDVNQALTK